MDRKPILIVSLLLLAVLAFSGFSGLQSYMKRYEANLEKLKALTIGNIDLLAVEDGSYTGAHKVFPIDVSVKVSVADHRMSDIVITKHKSGKGAPANAIVDRVLEHQSLQVDAIAGATYSSKVILKAIENALSKAGSP